MKKLLFLVSIILCGMVVMSSCDKTGEPGSKGDSWNTYSAKTDVWERYRGYLDKSPSQVEAILKAQGYVVRSGDLSEVWYEKTGLGMILVRFENSLSTELVAEEIYVRTFGDFMSYSNGLATFACSSYSTSLNGTSYSTRESFLAALEAVDKSNIDIQETCIVNQKVYGHSFSMEKGEYQGSAMVVTNDLEIER